MAHLAASRGHGECISCLLMHGAQLDIYTFDRRESVLDLGKRSGKYSRIEQARKFRRETKNLGREQINDWNRFRCDSLSIM